MSTRREGVKNWPDKIIFEWPLARILPSCQVILLRYCRILPAVQGLKPPDNQEGPFKEPLGQSGKNCRFTALHRQLAPLALDHIGPRAFL